MSDFSDTSAIWDLPHERNPLFVGRAELLDGMAKRMAAGDRSQVLHGLAGIGKTQAAVEFAYRNRAVYTLVWWVPAHGETSVLLAYEKLAERLGHRLSPRASADVAVETIDQLLAPHRYLLIFDGADDGHALRSLLPTAPGGHVLITSRHADWAGIAHTRPMRVLARDESVAFLRRRTEARDASNVEQVAQTLGDLPLALEQASALIKQAGLTFTEYLRRFETQWASMLGEGLRPVDYPRSVAMTWSLAFRDVERDSPAAADLLNLASFLNADHVPLQLLRDGADLLPPSLRGLAVDPRMWTATVATLLTYALAESDEPHAFGVHRLVAAVTRDRLSDAAQKVWCAKAISLLAGLFRFDSADVTSWAPCCALLPHVIEATAHAERLAVAEERRCSC